MLFEALTSQQLTHLPSPDLMADLKSTIYSVEKFQGSDRNLIIATMAISDRDQLQAEEEFIYDLNRFNVLTSRAKHKVILLCSEAFLEYIPKDRAVMLNANRIKHYARTFCNTPGTLTISNELGQPENVTFNWHV
jgi:hypothetical protein